MKTYQVIVTRDITESTVIHVQAKSEEEAHEKAEEMLMDAHDLNWEIDDCSESVGSITGCDEVGDDESA